MKHEPPYELPEGVGTVTIENGRALVCEIGLALRLGLQDPPPDPATAAELYPLFELCPGEERPEPGETLHDWPVFCWVTQKDAAKQVGLTPRQVSNLELKGLPTKGHRETRRYPLPHLHIWFAAYIRRHGPRGKVDRLPWPVAVAEGALARAETDLVAAESESNRGP